MNKQRGQPKKEPTTTISLRLRVEDKKKLKDTFGRRLNKMFNEWVDSLLKDS